MPRPQQSASSRLNQLGVRERRGQQRTTVVTKATITSAGTGANAAPAGAGAGDDVRFVVLADISLSGVGLHSVEPLNVGSRWKLVVSAGPMQLAAIVEVMNCRPREGGFVAGARFV
jgi:hypothetical protein